MNNYKRIIITGADGMLGRSFQEVLRLKYPSADVKALSRHALDVTNRLGVMAYAEYNPELIIHAASKVDADFCENNYEEARDIIINGTNNVIELAEACNATVLYPQTFLIFDGKVNPICELTVPNPLSNYGLLKLEAENAVIESDINSLIIRMGGFFGGNEKDKNFVGTIIRLIFEKVKNGSHDLEVGDRVWQPTYTFDLALNCLLLLKNGKSGIYNMSSLNSASFYQLTIKIVQYLGLENHVNVIEVGSQQFDDDEAAERPRNAILSNDKLSSAGMNVQRNWEQSLLEYLSSDYYINLIKNGENV